MSDPAVPRNLLAPADPIRTRRRRPATVGLARGLLFTGALLGLCSAIALLAGAGTVATGLRAAAVGVAPAQLDQIADVVHTVLVSTGLVALALALGMGAAAIGVGRGSRIARTVALSLVALSLCFGLGSASYTTLGRNVDWTGGVEPTGDQLRTQISRAYGEAMPGLLVGTTGGLTDLQALGYIAGAALLLAPASRPHFRRRPTLAGSGEPEPTEPTEPAESAEPAPDPEPPVADPAEPTT